MRNLTFILMIYLLFGSASHLVADDFEKGTELLLRDKPGEAVVYFERVIKADPQKVETYFYIGLAYEKLGLHDRAIAQLKSGIDLGLGRSEEFYLNIGNNYARKGMNAEAIEAYGKAIEINPGYSLAVLNRGNVNFRTKDYDAAIEDYETFLTIDPASPKSPEVVKMIAALREELVAIEQQKEEAQRIAAEQARQHALAEEQLRQETLRRQQEEQRRQEFLDSLFNSLSETGVDQTNLSAGTEGVKEPQDDLSRED